MRIRSPPNPLHTPGFLPWSRRLNQHMLHKSNCAAARGGQNPLPGFAATAGLLDAVPRFLSGGDICRGRRLSTLVPRARGPGQGQQQQPQQGKDASTGSDSLFPWTRLLNVGARRQDAGRAARPRDDEGDWNVSPEWWGTQGGGWGDNEGEIVFQERSSNGLLVVTAHPASTPKPKDWAAAEAQLRGSWEANAARFSPALPRLAHRIIGYEWRVLRFNHVTRQSVAKLVVLSQPDDPARVVLVQQPNCLAFEYLKSMVSAGLSAASLAGLDLPSVRNGSHKMRVLCIGLGGGSLPLYLAHNLPGATVEAVEIDGGVITAAIDAMGFPPCRHQSVVTPESGSRAGPGSGPENEGEAQQLWGGLLDRLFVYEGDGVDHVCNVDESVSYDMVFIDAYDGNDRVPQGLWDVNGPFLTSLRQRLHPRHGTVAVNLHSDSRPPPMVEKITGKFGAGFDARLPQGKVVSDTCLAYFRQVLESTPDSPTAAKKIAFTVCAAWQQNIALVVSRGDVSCSKPGDGSVGDVVTGGGRGGVSLERALQLEAVKLQQLLAAPFDFPKRVTRGFQHVSCL